MLTGTCRYSAFYGRADLVCWQDKPALHTVRHHFFLRLMSTTFLAKVKAFPRRCRVYTVDRLAPVALLWAAIGLGSRALPSLLIFIVKGSSYEGGIALESFADKRLIGLLVLGLWVLYGIFGLVRMVIYYGQEEEKNERNFFTRVYDELSGAATHIGCALIVMSFLGELKSSPWTVLGYAVLAVVAFRMPQEAPRK